MSNKTRSILEVLRKSTDHSRNYADYRAVLKKMSLPCLPFLGLFLTDLTFTDDGNADMRNKGKLINYDKYAKTFKIINDLMRYQAPYPFQEITEIADYILEGIEEKAGRDVQELYDLSLRLEPRDDKAPASSGGSAADENKKDYEAKLIMLQKAGIV